jgi:hypothetical protein
MLAFGTFTFVGVPWLVDGVRLCLGGVFAHPFDTLDLIGVLFAPFNAFRLIGVASWVGDMFTWLGWHLSEHLYVSPDDFNDKCSTLT